MSELITIGETMVSFVSSEAGYLRYAKAYEPRIAGAESNTAICVSRFGHSAAWASLLGEDEFGIFIRNSIRAEGVNTDEVGFSKEHPTGIMFKQRLYGNETSVFYYRRGSAASHMDEADVPAEAIGKARILHLSGITPALSESCLRLTDRAFSTAREKGCLISFDPNIRYKLWGSLDLRSILKRYVLDSDIVLIGLDEGQELFGSSDPRELSDLIFEQGRASRIAIKNGSGTSYAADRQQLVPIEPYPCSCVDPVGAGDAFNAGFLCGILEERSIKECGEMGACAGAMATECLGDTEGCPSRAELDKRLTGSKEIFR